MRSPRVSTLRQRKLSNPQGLGIGGGVAVVDELRRCVAMSAYAGATMVQPEFTYDNRTGRRQGPFLSLVSALAPPVARVQAQVVPYAASWQSHNRRAITASGRRWVVLGDSMSQGIGASSFDAGWVNQLHDRLAAEARPQIINLSASGARVADVLTQQLAAYHSLPAATDHADLVTVLIGSNDLFGGRPHRRRLPAMMAELLENVPRGSIVSTLTQPAPEARAANAHIERTGRAGSIEVVDLRRHGPPTWRGKLASDRFHPNDEGYRAIADAFEPAVLRALGLDPAPTDDGP